MEKHLIAEFEKYAREPVLAKMPDGSLVCTFLTGGDTEPDNENFAAVSYSRDGGKTWTEPKPLFNHSKRGSWCTSISVFDGVAVASVCTYNTENYYRELSTFFSESRDNGVTWTKPKSIRGHIDGCSLRLAVTLSNGDLLIPLYWQEAVDDYEWPENWREHFEVWRFVSGVGIRKKDDDVFYRYGYFADDQLSFWEPNAFETEPGHVIMYFRNRSRFLYLTESFDYGRTWCAPRQTDIPHSDSKVTCVKAGGTVIMINNAVGRGRTHLEISWSRNGYDFDHICYIEDENAGFFYPHAVADDKERRLYVAYENAKQHYLAIYSYDELGI